MTDPETAADASPPSDRTRRAGAISRAKHWDRIFGGASDESLSWFQSDPAQSFRLIEEAADRSARVIDIGGGTSPLVDRLLEAGFSNLTVLDVSRTAVERVRRRLGDRAKAVRFVIGDVTSIRDIGEFDVWHDRAVFHFLSDARDRSRYISLARRSIPAGGTLILATFAPEAPPRCSGLEVRRYSVDALVGTVGEGFALERDAQEVHFTPSGVRQPFIYAVFSRAEGRTIPAPDTGATLHRSRSSQSAM